MIQFVVIGLLCSAAVISGAPADGQAGRNLPPPPNAAAEARRLVHQSSWASVGTIPNNANVDSPTVSVVSTADSKVAGQWTGDIYFILMDQDLPTIDIDRNNKVTFMFSDAQDGECKEKNADPMGHLCARAMIRGEVETLTKGTDEYTRAWEAYAERHEFAKKMYHQNFKFCKLKISNVVVFSGYGGYRNVAPTEYYEAQL